MGSASGLCQAAGRGTEKRSPKVSAGFADLNGMAVTVEKVCDPQRFSVNQAIMLARTRAEAVPGFEMKIVRYLQSHCLSRPVAAIPTVFRGLEVLGGMIGRGDMEERRLIALLRPFLRSSDPQVASKCALVIGRRSTNLAWFGDTMAEDDFRIRANLIEALWGRQEPEIKDLLLCALEDSHQRVIANAAYGLRLLEAPEWLTGLAKLLESSHADFRISGIWLLRHIAPPDAPERVVKFIRDPDPGVRRAAFDTLVKLRKPEARNEPVAETPVAESPIVEIQVSEIHVTEAPITETQATETPATQLPAAEVPTRMPPEQEAGPSYWVPKLLLADR